METLWLGLAFLLAASSLGASGLLSLAFAGVAFVLGSLVLLTGVSLATSNVVLLTLLRQSRQSWSWFKGALISNDKVRINDAEVYDLRLKWEATSLTGSEHIDEPLNLILGYVLRDYIYPWHFKVTHDRAFPMHLKDTINHVIIHMSSKIKSVDWIPFLTTRLVDDVASHVRLFKKARLSLKIRSKADQQTDGKIVDLESLFFDAEVAMETTLCRDLAASIQQEELNYLQSVAEILLFLLLKEDDFNAIPMRTLGREIIVNVLLKPTLDLLSDPDFINQTLVWLYEDYKIKHDVFLTSIRYSENMEELLATRETLNKEISFIRSNDSKGELDSTLKQQLNSLLYLKKVIDARIHRIQSGSDTDSMGIPAHVDWNQMIGPGLKLFDLPIDVILKNNIALSYFIDYMTSIGCQSYLFFYLNIEGWKVSAETQIQALELDELHLKNLQNNVDDGKQAERQKKASAQKQALTENMREAAHSIYEEYLSEKANPRLKIDESVVKRLLFKIRTEPPDSEWFDESQVSIYAKLQSDERFLDAFKKSVGYVKLLAELDLLKDLSKEEDEDDDETNSLSGGEELSIYDSRSLDSDLDSDRRSHKSHKRTGSNISSGSGFHRPSPPPVSGGGKQKNHNEITASLNAQVTDVKIIKENVVKPYAMYTIMVKVMNSIGVEEARSILRRYSDFYALQEKISTKYPKLSKLPFPNKKTFGNMDKQVLEKRRLMLDAYLKELLKPATLQDNPELIIYMERFLDHMSSYESERQSGMAVVKAAVSVKNSVKSAAHVVTSVPSGLYHTMESIGDGLSKALHTNQVKGSNLQLAADGKVGAGLETEPSDNIPLRILLLFMDEVFDLQERNQWLRRQIVAVLRQLIKAMFGDIVNRRIIDYFAQMTAPERIGSYIESLKQSLWPDGYPAAPKQPRDENTKMRTRIVARAALFSSFSDDLRRVIGSETSKSGLIMLFDMLQHPVLNKRLGIVILEGIIETLFQEQDFKAIFQKLHSRSSRVRNELKNSQRKYADLRR